MRTSWITRRNSPSCSTRPLLVPGLVLAAQLSGCGLLASGIDSYTDCGSFNGDYQEDLTTEGALTDTIETGAPYPMTIVVSQDSLNRIFSAVSEGDLDTIEFTYTVEGIPVTIGIDPDLPLIQIGGVNGCDDCLLLEMEFGIYIELYGVYLGGTSGAGSYQFPLALVDNGTESTTVYARLGESQVVDIDVNTGDPDVDAYLDLLAPYISEAATIVIQEYYGDTELFTLNAWKLGNGDIKLLARGPEIHPETGTVVLGIHTNLVRPLSGTIAIEPTLPEGADLGMQFHPELIQQIVERMLNEGFIPRTYDTTGEPDEAGGLSVTLLGLVPAENGLLSASFRLWQLGGDYCGYTDLTADLGMSISDKAIKLTIANVQVTGSGGVGDLAVIASDWLESQLTLDVASYSELAINYRELSLPGGYQADMSSESFRLALDAQGLSVYLNVDQIIEAVTD